MALTPNKVLVVIAAGPLIGTAVAAQFASHGFTHVALLSRDGKKLAETASFVVPTAKDNGNANVTLKTYSADVAETESFLKVLKQIESDFGAPEVVVYNAAVIRYGGIGSFTEQDIVEDFKVASVGLYTAAKWAYPLLVENVKHKSADFKPTFFVTGGGPYKNPNVNAVPLSLSKAAQYSLTTTLAKTYEPFGVRTGYFVANKVIKVEEKYHNPKHIASLYWDMYAKEEGKWEYIFDMGYD